jgi:hypothetical protein
MEISAQTFDPFVFQPERLKLRPSHEHHNVGVLRVDVTATHFANDNRSVTHDSSVTASRCASKFPTLRPGPPILAATGFTSRQISCGLRRVVLGAGPRRAHLMRGCHSCFEPPQSTGHRQTSLIARKPTSRRQGILETLRRHPQRHENNAARASDPLSGQSVWVETELRGVDRGV